MKAYRVVLARNNKLFALIRVANNQQQIRDYFKDYYKVTYIEDVTSEYKLDLCEIEAALNSFNIKLPVIDVVISILAEHYDNTCY